MRVGVFHGNATDANPGGKAMFAREMARHLAHDHEVYLYTAADEPAGEDAERRPADVGADDQRPDAILDGVDVVRFPRFDGRLAERVVRRVVPLPTDRTLALAGAVRAGVAGHVDDHVDVLLTHRVAEDVVLSNLVDVPVVYQYHNVSSVGPAAKARERLTAADVHLANSPTIAREVAEKLGRRVDGVVTPGVDTTTFRPDRATTSGADPATTFQPDRATTIQLDHATTSRANQEPAIQPDEDTVLFVGRVVPEKGVYDLLAAVQQLDRDVDCYVVGPGDLDRLRSAAADLGVAGSLTAVGPVPNAALPGYYAAATVVCNPTHYEGFGMVNLEAMACGAALVTTRLPGVEEYATHDRNALLVEPGDVEGLADALASLLDDPARRERLADAAVETARGYSWDAQADRLAEICAAVVGE